MKRVLLGMMVLCTASIVAAAPISLLSDSFNTLPQAYFFSDIWDAISKFLDALRNACVHTDTCR